MSDSFELDTQAFVKIDKYELKLEKIPNQGDLFTSPQYNNNMNQMNLWNNKNQFNNVPLRVNNSNFTGLNQSFQTPLKPKTLNKPLDQGIINSDLEGGEDLWNLINELLQNGDKTPIKVTPKKDDLITDQKPRRKPQVCVLDPEEEDIIDALLTQDRSTRERFSQEFSNSQDRLKREFNNSQNKMKQEVESIQDRIKRSQSPMSIEVIPSLYNIDTSTRASELIELEPEPEFSEKKSNSGEKIEILDGTIEIEDYKPEINLQFSSPNIQLSFAEKQETLRPLTFSQQSQLANLSRNKDKGESSALSKEQQLEIIQLIGDKRHSSAKNSTVKCPSSQQKIVQEANECRICLCKFLFEIKSYKK